MTLTARMGSIPPILPINHWHNVKTIRGQIWNYFCSELQILHFHAVFKKKKKKKNSQIALLGLPPPHVWEILDLPLPFVWGHLDQQLIWNFCQILFLLVDPGFSRCGTPTNCAILSKNCMKITRFCPTGLGWGRPLQ